MSTIHNIHGDMTAATVAILPADEFAIYKASSGAALRITNAFVRAENYFAAGSTLTLTAAAHGGGTIKLDTAAGSVVTLPAASGTGIKFRFVVSVLATSNSHIVKVANSSDAMQGIIYTMDDTAANTEAYAAVAGTSDTITLNRTTTGSVTIGEMIEIEDFATNRWHVTGFITNTGSSATPFSNTV